MLHHRLVPLLAGIAEALLPKGIIALCAAQVIQGLLAFLPNEHVSAKVAKAWPRAEENKVDDLSVACGDATVDKRVLQKTLVLNQEVGNVKLLVHDQLVQKVRHIFVVGDLATSPQCPVEDVHAAIAQRTMQQVIRKPSSLYLMRPDHNLKVAK